MTTEIERKENESKLPTWFIKTVYTQKVKGVEVTKDQWWIAYIEKEYFTIHHLMHFGGTINSRSISDYFRKLDSLYPSVIKFRPITHPTIKAMDNLAFFRGDGNDLDPFVVRGKAIGEIIASPNFGSSTRNLMWYNSAHITESQRTFLHESFDAQLAKCVTMDLLKCLVKDAKRQCIQYTSGKLSELEDSILEFKKFLIHLV